MALSKGCTIALIVVAVIIVLLIITLIVIWINREKLVEAGLDYILRQVESSIVVNLPEGYTEDSVHQIFQDFKTAALAQEVEPQAMQELKGTVEAALADKEIDQEEGARILELMQEAMGREPYVPEEIPDSLQAVPDTL